MYNNCLSVFNYRMALDEIIKEAKRGKERAETMGPMGWYVGQICNDRIVC
jgi:hypothetical protein